MVCGPPVSVFPFFPAITFQIANSSIRIRSLSSLDWWINKQLYSSFVDHYCSLIYWYYGLFLRQSSILVRLRPWIIITGTIFNRESNNVSNSSTGNIDCSVVISADGGVTKSVRNKRPINSNISSVRTSRGSSKSVVSSSNSSSSNKSKVIVLLGIPNG